jgi:hypothetical protein
MDEPTRRPVFSLALLALLALAASVADAAPSYRTVSESRVLALQWSDERQSIRVVDKRGGEPWAATFGPEDMDLADMSEMWSTGLRSLLSIQYVNLQDRYLHLSYTNPILGRAHTEVVQTAGGLELRYEFGSLGLSVAVRIWVDGDRLHVLLPEAGMRETGSLGFYSVEVLPFLGTMADDPGDYYLYPDGCGALMRGKGPIPGARLQRWVLYSPEYIDLGAPLPRSTEMPERHDQAALPIFGVKRGGGAYLAAIVQGDHRAAIDLSPAGYVLPFHRISFDLLFRRPYRDARETASTRATELYHDRVELQRLAGDREVVYVFLPDADASYSGMANAYRHLMIERGELRAAVASVPTMPLALDVFMGITERRILVDRFVTMTTFPEVRLMLEELRRLGVSAVDATLMGWSAGGYGRYPERAEAAKSMGGDRALRELCEYSSDAGARVFLQTNPVDADREVRGFSVRRDVVHDKGGTQVSDGGDERLLMNPSVALDRYLSRTIPFLRGFSAAGVCLARMGWLVFDDFNERYPSSRQETIRLWQRFLEASRAELGAVAVRGPNAYAVGLADRLLDVPDRDTGLFLTDEVVPFYQIVVHGMVPYSGPNPGNLSHDSVEQKLRWVEYGFLPSYQLTWGSPELLRRTNYSELFSSRFADWAQPAAQVWREMAERLGDLWKRTIRLHQRVSPEVAEVTYDDGSIVVVNYGARPYVRKGLLVGPRDFGVIRPGRGTP